MRSMEVWGITDVGAVRKENQDAYQCLQVSKNMSLCVVCDGMGGALAGNVASQLAVDSFFLAAKSLSYDQWECDPINLLTYAAEQANETVFHRATTDPNCRGMGTTLVAVLVIGNTAYLINIGDSRGYLVQQNGLQRITRDHSLVEDLVAQGKLTPDEARCHPQKNFITRALGAEPILRADTYTQVLSAGERILLCSDGLINVVTDQEVLYEVVHGGPEKDCCERLLDIAITRGAPDNVTVVLVQL